MESFWDMVRKILGGLGNKDVSGLAEFEFETDDPDEAIITFHTSDEGKIVLSIFDDEQWSLIEDMAKFLDKPVEEVVKELDPSGPNIYVLDPEDLN